MNPVHFSSDSEEWETPQDLFDALDDEFGFTLDVCATEENAKCEEWISKYVDGLTQDWAKAANGGAVWANPPYGRGIGDWVAKAAATGQAGRTVVALLPARTDTRWFHDHIWDVEHGCPKPRISVRFLKGRLKFGKATSGAPFPSMVVVFE